MKKIDKTDMDTDGFYYFYHGKHNARYKHFFLYKVTEHRPIRSILEMETIDGVCLQTPTIWVVIPLSLKEHKPQLLHTGTIFELSEEEIMNHVLLENI